MNIFTKREKTQDILVLVLINIVAITASFMLHTNFLTSTLLFLAVPSVYLMLKEKKNLPKILFASFAAGLLFGFFFDFLAELNNAWNWNGGLIFGKILGVVQIDVMIWFFFWVFHIFLFYEHFIDKSRSKVNFSPIGIKIFAGLTLLVIALLATYFLAPSLLYFDKAYLVLALIVSIPFVIVTLKKPSLVLHSVPMILYFFFVYFTHEVTALKLGQWTFPGDYIGLVYIFDVTFPIEELIFWMILSGVIGSIYYEIAFDNQKN